MSDVTAPQPPEPGDGLVERLHAIDRSHLGDGHYCNWPRNPDGPEAVARIQAFEQQVATLTAERDAIVNATLDAAERAIADTLAFGAKDAALQAIRALRTDAPGTQEGE
jgi:hypothetical protein